MRDTLKNKIIEVCNKKIESKGSEVGLSFYAFFANKNDDPAFLMEAAKWWIMTNKLDHFEKAIKIKRLVETWPEPPELLGEFTVVDVVKAKTVVEHKNAVRAWARSAWNAWFPHHDIVRSWHSG